MLIFSNISYGQNIIVQYPVQPVYYTTIVPTYVVPVVPIVPIVQVVQPIVIQQPILNSIPVYTPYIQQYRPIQPFPRCGWCSPFYRY
jgi:hypothetical protein